MRLQVKTIVILCVLCVGVYSVFSGMVNFSHGEDWTSLGNDSGRGRINTVEVLSDSFSQSWHYSISSTIVSSPAVSDGFVVFADRNGYIRAVEETNGAPCWIFNTNSEVIASPAILAGRVYMPAANGKLYCLRLSDGDLLWNYTLGGTEISSPNISNSVLFMGSGFPNHRVIGLNVLAEPPQLLWQAAVEQIVYSSPAISGNRVIIGCDSGRYYALDKDTGAEAWSYNTGGDVLLSSPLVVGNAVYLLPGGANNKFYRVDMDSTLWPGANWDVTLTDPNLPAGTILGTKLSVSSPIFTGDDIGFVIRFDYSMDTNADSMADQYVLNEYAIAINTATRTVKWQIATGSLTTANQNNIPPFGLCPAPAAFRSASGYFLAVVSSLASQLRIVDATNGSVIRTCALDAPAQASPVVANSRIFAATKNGSVYAFQNDINHAPAPPISGFLPVNGSTIITGTVTNIFSISWSGATDPDAAHTSGTLRYVLRFDDDGEVMENCDLEYQITAGVTSVILPPLTVTGTRTFVYALRTLDPASAYSQWSALQSFSVTQDVTPPDPANTLRAMPSNRFVDLFWVASPSSDVKGYWVSYKQSGGSFGTAQFTGNVTNHRVTGLTNGVTYTFRLVAEDQVGLQGNAVEVSATPDYYIFMMGAPYETLADALAVAQSGDTITLAATAFVLPATLYLKEGVHLRGVAPHLTILDATDLATAIQLSGLAGGIMGTISNLLIYGADDAIDASGHTVSVENTVIKSCGNGIVGDSASNIEVINNSIIYNGGSGIYVAGNSIIRNNIIIGNTDGIYWWGTPADPDKLLKVSYNNIYGNSTDYVDCVSGTDDISAAVIFVDELNNNYCEVADSATIDMGDPADDWSNEPEPNGDRINMGAFGNTVYAARSASIRIVTTSLSDGESGVYYSARIGTAGGAPPLTWTLISDAIPPGLTLNLITGEITGTVPVGNAATYIFLVNVRDTISGTDTALFSITIRQAGSNLLRIATSALSDGEEMAQYQATISAADGFPPYVWSIISGALPPNLVLDAATGQINGTPPADSAGAYSFVVQVIDADLYDVSNPFTLIIGPRPSSTGTTGSSGPPLVGDVLDYKSRADRCFIATAAYGSPMAPAVVTLRQFRDEYLTANRPGQWFVSQYYRYSPPLANYISRHIWAKTVSRVILIPPVAGAWIMVATNTVTKILLALLICLLVFRTLAVVLCVRGAASRSSGRGTTYRPGMVGSNSGAKGAIKLPNHYYRRRKHQL